jgi:ribA/ribD-fused uncharacterized protein
MSQKADVIDRFTGPYDFLSNFYPSAITLDGLDFNTVEHAFQAAKTSDLDERQALQLAKSPAEAKRLGRKVTLRPDWEQVKFSIMEALVRQKFTRYPELAEMLLDTGDARLIEGNTWNDRTWGMTKTRQGEYIGKNWLGIILMKIRDELRESN